MSAGYVKLHREILDHELLAYDNSAFLVFIKLLTKVDRKTGQYTTGRFKLAALVNLPPSTAWGALMRLEKAGMTDSSADSRKTIISICNWSKWQESPTAPPTANRVETDTKQEERSKKRLTSVSLTVDKKNPDITKLIKTFEDKIGKPSRDQSMAAALLLRQHGLDKTLAAIDAVVASRDQRFAPSIASLEELCDKWVKLENFAVRKMGEPRGMYYA